MSQILSSPLAGLAVDLAIDILLKATIVLAVAGMAVWCLRGTSAAMRHAAWSVALTSLFALPLLSMSFPAWRVDPLYVSMSAEPVSAVSHAPSSNTPRERERAVPAASVSNADVAPLAAADRSVMAGDTQAPVPSLPAILLAVWGAGVIAVVGRLALDAVRVHGITRRARVCTLLDVCELAERVAARMGIRRRVRLLVSDEVPAPLAWGVWVPVVILPGTATRWTTERMQVVLLHELAHVRRCDYAVLLMVEGVRALYWLNPLVWLAARACATERERACDDRALHHGIRSDIYATHLLDFARAQMTSKLPRAAFAMAQQSTLAQRIRSVLTRGLDRGPASQGWVVLASVAALGVAFPVATVDMWGTAPSSELGSTIVQPRPDLSLPTPEDHQGDPVAARIRELQANDPLVRRYAAWALGELENDRGVPPLVDRLRDDNADVRLVSAWALGEIKDPVAIDPLIELLEDRDPLVREMAVLALGEIEHASAITPLADAFQRRHELGGAVIWALGEIDTERAHQARRVVFDEMGILRRSNDEVWIGHLGATDQVRGIGRDLSALTVALRDSDPNVRCAAAEWLGLRGDERAVESLLETLRDPTPEVRAMAVWALDEINPWREARR